MGKIIIIKNDVGKKYIIEHVTLSVQSTNNTPKNNQRYAGLHGDSNVNMSAKFMPLSSNLTNDRLILTSISSPKG